MLYGKSIFRLMLNTNYDGNLSTLPAHVRPHIRHIDIGAFWFGNRYLAPGILTDPAFPSVMASLSTLRLELHQPLYAPMFGRPDPRVRAWLDWVRPVLERVNEIARGNMGLGVEIVRAGDETLNLARSCLRDVDCVVGQTWLYGWPIRKGTCRRRECGYVS